MGTLCVAVDRLIKDLMQDITYCMYLVSVGILHTNRLTNGIIEMLNYPSVRRQSIKLVSL